MTDSVCQHIGSYRLLRLLGRGGFASIYLGEHSYLRSPAALKVLHTYLSEEDAAQFLREAQTLARLSHPHIVRVLDFAVQDGTPFLVMEYAPGGTSRQRHPPGTCLPVETVVSYVQQVASALQYAHDRRLIHRDVKPENLFLNERGEVLLGDFGLAMLTPHTSSGNTQAREQPLTGTTPYLAPEQVHGKPRPASDQYALGVVVYEWLCGRHPFGGTPIEVAMQHLSAPPLPLRDLVPDLSPAIEEVVLRALAKEPGQRFPSVQDFATALERACQEAVSPHARPVAFSVPTEHVQEQPSFEPHVLDKSALYSALTAVRSPEGERQRDTAQGTARPGPMWKMPTPFTPLVGREQDVEAVCTLLSRPEVRLVTLVGTGGVGKTRLSIEVATRLREHFAAGVCFVELAPISDPDLVMPAIALGIQEKGALSIVERVKVVLREQQLLLILDSFEQVMTAAPQVVDLLTACPQLKVLVTSREVLHVQAEHLFPVSPLALPDLAHLPEGEELAQCAAVSLFLQRARTTLPCFQMTSANARAIAEICSRLDGLPLAIELAAARIKLLPPQALLERLGHRLQVLTSRAKHMPIRQQTLRNTIQWSYNLLNTEEQRLFRRLSVFVGGCTLEAVETICAALSDGDATIHVLDGVASLLDKSLLQQTEQEGEEPRLSMLETVREYGLETLTENGDLEAVRRAHALYYLALAEQAEPELQGPQQVAWLERLEREHDNLRAAMQWSSERGEVGQNMEMALRLGGALRQFWRIRGHFSEGRTFLERALAGSGGVAGPARAKALLAAADVALNQGDFDRGETLCKESLVLCRELEDRRGIAFSLRLLGWAVWNNGDPVTGRSLMEESLALRREVGHKYGVGESLFYLALLAGNQGEYARGLVLVAPYVGRDALFFPR